MYNFLGWVRCHYASDTMDGLYRVFSYLQNLTGHITPLAVHIIYGRLWPSINLKACSTLEYRGNWSKSLG